MPENFAIEVEQRHAHVARRPYRPDIGIVAVDVEQIIGNMNQTALIDNPLAGSPVHNHFPTVEPLLTHPERQSFEPPRFRKIFGDPRAVRIQRRREVFHQGLEKPFAGLRRRALENRSQGNVDIDIFQRWTIHSSPSLKITSNFCNQRVAV
jgi:hypothetical protein